MAAVTEKLLSYDPDLIQKVFADKYIKATGAQIPKNQKQRLRIPILRNKPLQVYHNDPYKKSSYPVDTALGLIPTPTPISDKLKEFKNKLYPGGSDILLKDILEELPKDLYSKQELEKWFSERYRPFKEKGLWMERGMGPPTWNPFNNARLEQNEINNQKSLLNLLPHLEKQYFFNDKDFKKTITDYIYTTVLPPFYELKQQELLNSQISQNKRKNKYTLINLNKGEAVPFGPPVQPYFNLLNAPKYNKSAIEANLGNLFGSTTKAKLGKASRKRTRKARKTRKH
jgi:hypothetical protein